MIRRAAAPLMLSIVLSGCVTTGGGSVAGGECKVFERPPYAVRGVTQYDQDVADNFVESGVGGCKWERPAARPAELDAAPAPRKIKKKKPVWLRLLHWPAKAAPVIVVPEAPAAPVVEVAPAPLPPAPRSAIDELLHPEVR